MKAKRIIAFLVLACTLLLCTACGCAKKDVNSAPTEAPQQTQETVDATPSASAQADNAENDKTEDKKAPAPTPVPESKNKEVVSDDKAPDKIFWLMSGENNLTYHLENCAQIKDKGAQEVSWEIVKTIGLRQCPECNPPQYEGYVNN
ncbi:MAG: hypothetical protein IKW59_06665 [Clostridia bacterium]|nr:hypothetical protein [Clostridia bacterium]